MQGYGTLLRRELAAYFTSVTGYVVIAVAAFLTGLSFVNLMIALQGEPMPVPVTELFYQTHYFWLILLLTAPVITMRLFALEKFAGTYETLLTTPVREGGVVAAKFTAAVVFYALMWLPLLGCLLVVRRFGGDAAAVDWRTVGTTYLGILLYGGLFCAMGCFASALSRAQTVSAMLSLLLGVTLFLLAFLARQLPPAAPWPRQVLAHFALFEYMQDFARGVVDTRPVILCVSLSLLFLYLTLRVVDSRRWR